MFAFRSQRPAMLQTTDVSRSACRNLARGLSAIVVFLAGAAIAQAQTPDFSFTLSSSADPAQVLQTVDLVAVVTGGGAGGNDTITFTDAFGGTFGGTDVCSNVPVSMVDSQEIAHCVVTFVGMGTHYLDAELNFGTQGGDGGVVVPASNVLPQRVTAPVNFDANQLALTGSWYNPATPGQGLELAVYPDSNGAGSGTLFGGWFTYDTAGNQQWVTLQGNLLSSNGSVYSLGIYEAFDGYFDAPPIISAIADGSAALTFYDCNHAALSYYFADERRIGTIPYVRLSSPTGCSTAVPAVTPGPLPANYNDVLHSGAWYDPVTSGQGLVVDIIPSQHTFFAAWYTYAPQSEGAIGLAAQRWFTLQTNNYTPGDLTLENVPIYSSSGGVFNQPSAVTTVQVGTANLTFTSCSAMTIQYAFTAGEFDGLTGSINERNAGPVSGCL